MAVAMNKDKYRYFYIPPEMKSPIRFHSGRKKRCVPLPPRRLHFIHPHSAHTLPLTYTIFPPKMFVLFVEAIESAFLDLIT